jgi:hypothetical protein
MIALNCASATTAPDFKHTKINTLTIWDFVPYKTAFVNVMNSKQASTCIYKILHKNQNNCFKKFNSHAFGGE